MTDTRWARLVEDLQAAGFAPRLDEKPYSEIYCGRARSGVTHSITILVPGKGLVSVSDKWWVKNPDTWLGWTVCAEDAEGITLGRPTWGSKKRTETVAAVNAALATLNAA